MRILNSKGQEVKLDQYEQHHADMVQNALDLQYGRALQKVKNSLGYEVNITTLTTILKSISEQKFFEMKPSDYLPIKVGEGSFSSNLLAYLSFSIGDDFASGIINTSSNDARQAVMDAGVSPVSIPVFNWAKKIGWSIFDIQMAAKAGNWDLISAKERSRKKNWDLGIQKVAFLGLPGDTTNCPGLLNLSGVTVDTTTIPQNIYTLGAVDLKQFVSTVVQVYRANNNSTAWPTHFILPEEDYLGLVGQASAEFPIKSTLELLMDAFKIATSNPNFKILPCKYADPTALPSGQGVSAYTYVLLNYDEDSLVMNVPVPYTNTLANSLDNFMFQNSGYGQFTGVLNKRPLEVYYFQHA